MEFLDLNKIDKLPNVPIQEIVIEEWKTKVKIKGLTKKMQVELALGVILSKIQLKNFKTNPELSFTFRLARDLSMTVGELNATMSSYEFTQWVTFYLWEQEERNKAQAIAEAEAKKRR